MRKEFWTSLTFKQITMKMLFAEMMKKGESLGKKVSTRNMHM